MTPTASRTGLLDERELAAWRGMLRLVLRARLELDRRMRAEHGLTIAEYDVLVPLALAPEHRVRMSDLADQVLQPRSSLTRLVTGLETRGLVRRNDCTSDRRGVEAELTEAGVEAHRAARETHHRHVRELALDGLSRRQLDELAAAWRTVDPSLLA